MKNSCTQIHIIPFDIGYVFVDVLAVDNTSNLIFAENFIKALSCESCSINPNVKVYENLKLSYVGKAISKYRFINTEMAENAICYVRLKDNLYCYVLANGTGVFVLGDFNETAIKKTRKELNGLSNALIANFQKKISQSTILNKYSGKDVFPEEELLMLEFRKLCWEIAERTAQKHKVSAVRKFSSNLNYKADGLSYVLTIYVMRPNFMSDNEVNYLMYSPIFSKVVDKNSWEKINNAILNGDNSFTQNAVQIGNSTLHFSWAGVGIVSNDNASCYEDLVKSSIISTVVKAELYVQSRWFIADNSMDNVNKSMQISLEKLQRIESLMEFSQAELDNEISANMNTMYKNVLEKIIDTSEVRSLYKSVISQIHTQKKIKEAHNKDKQSRNRFISNLFLAVFTASSFFDTLLNLINKTFSWTNVVLFSASMAIAVGTVIFDYKNN